MAVERDRVMAVVGMTREAKILAGEPVIIGGGDAVGLSGKLEAELGRDCVGVISFGLCGALDPKFKVGDLVIGAAVVGEDGRYDADPEWTARLSAALPEATVTGFAQAERPVASAEAKAQLRQATGAGAVDLETYLAARWARWFGLRFAVLRAISDDASRALPHAAQVGLGADGRPAIGPVLASLGANPWQVFTLVRTALEAEEAFHALERARNLLGPGLGGLDLG